MVADQRKTRIKKLFSIIIQFLSSVLLFTVSVMCIGQFLIFLVAQFLFLAGSITTEATLTSLPTLASITLTVIFATGIPVLLLVFLMGKNDVSLLVPKLEVFTLRIMLILTSIMILVSALGWFSYLSFPRFEALTFIEGGIFTLLLAFDLAITKKYLSNSESEALKKQKPIIMSRNPDQDIFYV